MKTFGILVVMLLVIGMPKPLQAEARVESNIIYGMYSGLALLMDIHYPETPNGVGIIYIRGTGWYSPLSLDAEPANRVVGSHINAIALLEKGYTLFAVNHRTSPRFRYPAAVEDTQRAVRYVRHNAPRFGIDPERIGAVGTSAGGYLVNMLGVMDGVGKGAEANPIDQESSKVQAVVVYAAPTDFTAWIKEKTGDISAFTSFLGTYLPDWEAQEKIQEEYSIYAEASPVSYVTSDDPPFLLIHGDADDVVPINQAILFEKRLSGAGVVVELIKVVGGGHGPSDQISDPERAMVAWFDRHLRSQL